MEIIEYMYYYPEEAMIVVLVILLFIALIASFIKRQQKRPQLEGFRNIFLKQLNQKKAFQFLNFSSLVRGTIVIGGAGSGKTKSIGEPILDFVIEENLAGIIYDFKFPILANRVYTNSLLRTSTTLKIRYVNFVDPCRSNRFNVFAHINNSTHAKEYANAFILNLLPETIKQQDFFVRTATSLLAATIFYFSRNLKQYCTLPHVISFLLSPDIPKIIEIINKDPQASDLAASIRSGLASEKQTAGVISTLQNALSTCANPIYFWVLSGDDFDLHLNDPTNPSLLVIGNDATMVDTISPLISLVITVATKHMNVTGKEKSIILLDEAPTLYIPNFDLIPATGRENKIATVYIAQDLAQMEDRYGEKKAEVLLGNLANQFYGKITNPKTAEKVSKIFGKEDVLYESRSNTASQSNYSYGKSHSYQQRDRVTTSNLLNLNPGQFVASTTVQKAFKAKFNNSKFDTIELPKFCSVTEIELEDNYNKIKKDIHDILNSNNLN